VLRARGLTGSAHIHEGPCGEADPAPANSLEPVVRGRSETVVPASLDHLRSSPHAIDVHGATAVACGTVGD
jgi:hypothetical protein